ncbi:MAG: hypothetical protein LBS56_09375 [Propionibacteriaceae bacterium]|jgi:hypothetical protein|nr:hypothetical protein [Propionibacteriaceae bacterium]
MSDKSDIAQLVESIARDARDIVVGEAALAQVKLRPVLKGAKRDAMFLVAGVAVGVSALVAFAIAFGLAVAWCCHAVVGWSAFPAGVVGFTVALVVLGAVAAVVLLVKWPQFKAHVRRARAELGQTGSDLGQALTALHTGIAHGQELVKSGGQPGA